MDILNLGDHMAFTCECGSVHFHLLRTKRIECADCRLLFGGWGSDLKVMRLDVEVDDLRRDRDLWKQKAEGWFTKFDELYASSVKVKPVLDAAEELAIHIENQKRLNDDFMSLVKASCDLQRLLSNIRKAVRQWRE